MDLKKATSEVIDWFQGLCIFVFLSLRLKVLLHCFLHTLPCSLPWGSLVSNEASAHWSGRQSCVLLAVWCIETSLCLDSCSCKDSTSWRCYSLWKTERGVRCSYGNDFKEFLLLRCLIVAHTAGLVSNMSRSSVTVHVCMCTAACMWSVHMHVHESLSKEVSYVACECQWFAPKCIGI